MKNVYQSGLSLLPEQARRLASFVRLTWAEVRNAFETSGVTPQTALVDSGCSQRLRLQKKMKVLHDCQSALPCKTFSTYFQNDFLLFPLCPVWP